MIKRKFPLCIKSAKLAQNQGVLFYMKMVKRYNVFAFTSWAKLECAGFEPNS